LKGSGFAHLENIEQVPGLPCVHISIVEASDNRSLHASS